MTIIREQITHKGQAYYDEPVFARPRETPISLSVSAAFHGGEPQRMPAILLRHERIRLDWLTKPKKGRSNG